ncbi:MAG: hypothetical protein V1838_02750 [Patescibacteria group bacterium]
MAIHKGPKSMLKESLKEMLVVAEYCINFRKDISWGEKQINGCLGYPAAMMLFSIADTIGSFFRGNEKFKIRIEKSEKFIKNTGHNHLYILNSDFYDQQHLTEGFIKDLYDSYRSSLTHNAILLPNRYLNIGEDKEHVFELKGNIPFVHLRPFLNISKIAVNKFLNDIDNNIDDSEQLRILSLKKDFSNKEVLKVLGFINK